VRYEPDTMAKKILGVLAALIAVFVIVVSGTNNFMSNS
jgi:hypothetical protein